jgi:hypothetical protein
LQQLAARGGSAGLAAGGALEEQFVAACHNVGELLCAVDVQPTCKAQRDAAFNPVRTETTMDDLAKQSYERGGALYAVSIDKKSKVIVQFRRAHAEAAKTAGKKWERSARAFTPEDFAATDNIAVRRTHNLDELGARVREVCPRWVEMDVEEAARLRAKYDEAEPPAPAEDRFLDELWARLETPRTTT